MLILICDDSAEDRKYCHDLIDEYIDSRHIDIQVQEFSSGKELLFHAEDIHTNVDLIYMDVRMPDVDGLQTARELRRLGYNGEIVMYARSAKYAVDAYDFDAMHYIVKDVTPKEKFMEVLERVCKRRADLEKKVLVLSCAGESRCVQIDEIKYFEIHQRIITLHDMEGTFSFYSTMGKLEEQLFGKGFIRVHKSMLVNQRYIMKATAQIVTLLDGTQLPVGRKYVDNLKNHRQKKQQ